MDTFNYPKGHIVKQVVRTIWSSFLLYVNIDFNSKWKKEIKHISGTPKIKNGVLNHHTCYHNGW